MILQTCKCSVSPRSLIETYVYCTFLYRLLTTKNGFHQRVTWVAQHFSTWLSWPDERNSGEVLSHRHPWGWGIAPEFASVLNRHVEDVFFFFFFGMRYAMTSSWLWCHVSLKKLTYKVCAVGGAVCLSKWPFKKKQCRPCSTAWTRIMTMSLLIASSWQLLCRRFQEGKWENRNQSENIRRYNRINLSPIMSQLCHIYIIFYTLTEYI